MRTSTDFRKWYTVESKAATKASILRFKLLETHWYDGASSALGEPCIIFNSLKQAIWDSSRLTFFLKYAPTLFHILYLSATFPNALSCPWLWARHISVALTPGKVYPDDMGLLHVQYVYAYT